MAVSASAGRCLLSQGFKQSPAPASTNTNLLRGKGRPAAEQCVSGPGRPRGSSDPLDRGKARKPRPAASVHACTQGHLGGSQQSSASAASAGSFGSGPRQRPEACQLPTWWRRRQGGRCHMAKQPMIFRAAPPAEHERRKCRGAAFPVPAAAPAGYIICRGGLRSPTSGFPAPPGCAEPCDTVRCRRLPSKVRQLGPRRMQVGAVGRSQSRHRGHWPAVGGRVFRRARPLPTPARGASWRPVCFHGGGEGRRGASGIGLSGDPQPVIAGIGRRKGGILWFCWR